MEMRFIIVQTIKETVERIILFLFMEKRNTETDNKWSLSYGTAPGIKCLELTETKQSTKNDLLLFQ